MRLCVVYSCRNRLTGDQYIGSTTRGLVTRQYEHEKMLNADAYRGHWQNSWNKNKHQLEIYEWREVDWLPNGSSRKEIEVVEQFHLDVFWPTGYNDNPVAGSPPKLSDLDDEIQLVIRAGRRIRGLLNPPPSFDELSPDLQNQVLQARALKQEETSRKVAEKHRASGHQPPRRDSFPLEIQIEIGKKQGAKQSVWTLNHGHTCECGRSFNNAQLKDARWRDQNLCPSCRRPLPEKGDET